MSDTRLDPARNRRVYSEGEFLQAVRRERVRCDRNGDVFSVMAWSCGMPHSRFESLALAVASRVRACDQVGVLDGDQIAILLPATDKGGAERLLANIRPVIESVVVPEALRVSTYPANGSPSPGALQSGTYGLLDEALAPMCAVRVPPWKRVLDIVGAVAGLILFFPLFLLLPPYIKLVSPGPVFFKQQRVGYRGRLFTFLKFRTMKVNNDDTDHRQLLSTLIKTERPMTKLDANPRRRDPRVFPGGNLLRKLSLDEVPQFINVLRGEMSLVGPRPCIPYEAAEYARWHTQRFDVMPGLTGLWQVSGKNSLSFADMVRLDNTYARTMSFWLDVKILLLTFPALFLIAAEALISRIPIHRERNDKR